jgi:imidazolonepropionase-like amidohydrolase
MSARRLAAAVAAISLAAFTAQAQTAPNERPAKPDARYVSVDAPIVALIHARVIDGTGAAARTGQTILIEGADIKAVGPDAQVQVPAGAKVIDLSGKSVLPGWVMVHEHLFYPTGPTTYGNVAASFAQLYLAGGATTIRTAGDMTGFGDLNLAKRLRAGMLAGPYVDATGPYLDEKAFSDQMPGLKGPGDATSLVNYWADHGATSFKAYMNLTRAELSAAIKAAHARNLKVTGHLCSVTGREAVELGIDNLEHAFTALTDFWPDKQPDVCPNQNDYWAYNAKIDPADPRVKSLIAFFVARKVPLTSTVVTLEALSGGRPTPQGLDMLEPQLKADFERGAGAFQQSGGYVPGILENSMKLEAAFVRAGGYLMSGTDPSVRGVIPGYANQRQVELLVEAGLTPLEAIRISTKNGADYLGRGARVGTVAAGKQADLQVIDGDPSANIADVRKLEIVFRAGVGYDPEKLRAPIRGKVGLF